MDALVITLSVLVMVAACPAVRGENFKPERMRLIDSRTPDRFLFRGNMPIENGSFDYSGITKVMKSILESKHMSLPTNFSLVDVSYLNVFEMKDLMIEKRYFERNPSKGEFHNWVIAGNPVAPPQNDLAAILAMLPFMHWGNMLTVVEKLHTLLTQHSGPTVVYSHCEAGLDRTGQVSGAYSLRYLNQSFAGAIYMDNAIGGREMDKTSKNALQWYCYYLLYKERYRRLDCILPY